MKTYLKILLTAAIFAAVLGVLGPWLISAKSTESVMLGFVLTTTALPGAIYWIWRREFASLTQSFKENDKS